MAGAGGVSLNHIARETADVDRLARFYQEVLGFESIETPKFGEFKVVWLRIPSSMFSLHPIERNPDSRLLEGPWIKAGPSVVADPSAPLRGHHLTFVVPDFGSFVRTLKEKGIEYFEKTQPDGKTKQVFFFDPDGLLSNNHRAFVLAPVISSEFRIL